MYKLCELVNELGEIPTRSRDGLHQIGSKLVGVIAVWLITVYHINETNYCLTYWILFGMALHHYVLVKVTYEIKHNTREIVTRIVNFLVKQLYQNKYIHIKSKQTNTRVAFVTLVISKVSGNSYSML